MDLGFGVWARFGFGVSIGVGIGIGVSVGIGIGIIVGFGGSGSVISVFANLAGLVPLQWGTCWALKR